MNIQNKKVLITGGGSGIGFSIAKAFSEAGAQVILVGRNEEKLKNSAALLENASYIVADISKRADTKSLQETVTMDYGGIDILVNNAGISHYLPVILDDESQDKGKQEMLINFFAVLDLVNLFLPGLKAKGNTAIVNVSSALAYVPSIYAATYCASKAALHSYTQALRYQLEKDGANIKIFEVFPPLTDTDMTTSFDAPKIAPEIIASDLVNAFLTDQFSIRSGPTEDLYQAMLASPENALLILNN